LTRATTAASFASQRACAIFKSFAKSMMILPPSRAGRIRLAVLLAIFFAAAAYFRPDRFLRATFYDKREGDIVFQSLPTCELTDAIEGISKSPWSHCGVLVREHGKWMVAEAP